jgi:hypothetical protein
MIDLRGNTNYLGSQDSKSNKLPNFRTTESLWRTQNDVPNTMKETQEVLKSFTPKSQQSN